MSEERRGGALDVPAEGGARGAEVVVGWAGGGREWGRGVSV